MAFRSASITTNIPAFQVGTLVYPPLNNVTIPFAAADQLVNASTANRIVAPYDFIWDDDLPLDFVGHGTHVAGTIGQITNDNTGPAGVAFNVKLMPIKVIDDVWDLPAGLAEFRNRRPRRAGDPLRGGSRREGPEHEHRPDRRRAGVRRSRS